MNKTNNDRPTAGQAVNHPRAVWLVRHGNRMDFVSPEWLATAARPHDPPLSPDGVVQAREVGVSLAGERIDHIFASPFLRAVQTASQIADVLDRPVRIENGLCETFLPEWCPTDPRPLAARELKKQFPRVDVGYLSAVNPTYPETDKRMAARTTETIGALTRSFAGNLLLVGHGGSMWGLCRALVGNVCSIHAALCCRIKVAQRDGRWVLEMDGRDTSHLSRSEQQIRLA